MLRRHCTVCLISAQVRLALKYVLISHLDIQKRDDTIGEQGEKSSGHSGFTGSS